MITNNVFFLIFLVLMFVFPIAQSIFTWKNFDQLGDEESELAKNCGAHMKNFNKSRNGKCITWFAMFRHFPKVCIMCIIFVYSQDLPGIQIISVSYIALYEIIFTGLVRPFLTDK